jgi:16S rRNA (cytosine967-C5)-methyltransferase
LDLCAAPGGKTTHIGALMENTGRVTACDIYPHKLKLIAENAARLKLENIKTELQDGCVFREEWEAAFDRVLVDAPCSGLGVLRRRAEARWTKTETGLRDFPTLQQKILDNASRYVKPGGVLVYSTCTIEDRENRILIETFLQNHREWKQTGFAHPRTKKTVKELQLYPQRDGVDGFYLTVLQKDK